MNNLKFITLLFIVIPSLGIFAQVPKSLSYQEIAHIPEMEWTCPDIKKYQDMLTSAQDNDYKTYANNVKEKFGLHTISQSEDKYILTQAILSTENPMFSTDNMLDYLSTWIKKNKG